MNDNSGCAATIKMNSHSCSHNAYRVVGTIGELVEKTDGKEETPQAIAASPLLQRPLTLVQLEVINTRQEQGQTKVHPRKLSTSVLSSLFVLFQTLTLNFVHRHVGTTFFNRRI